MSILIFKVDTFAPALRVLNMIGHFGDVRAKIHELASRITLVPSRFLYFPRSIFYPRGILEIRLVCVHLISLSRKAARQQLACDGKTRSKVPRSRGFEGCFPGNFIEVMLPMRV